MVGPVPTLFFCQLCLRAADNRYQQRSCSQIKQNRNAKRSKGTKEQLFLSRLFLLPPFFNGKRKKKERRDALKKNIWRATASLHLSSGRRCSSPDIIRFHRTVQGGEENATTTDGPTDGASSRLAALFLSFCCLSITSSSRFFITFLFHRDHTLLLLLLLSTSNIFILFYLILWKDPRASRVRAYTTEIRVKYFAICRHRHTFIVVSFYWSLTCVIPTFNQHRTHCSIALTHTHTHTRNCINEILIEERKAVRVCNWIILFITPQCCAALNIVQRRRRRRWWWRPFISHRSPYLITTHYRSWFWYFSTVRVGRERKCLAGPRCWRSNWYNQRVITDRHSDRRKKKFSPARAFYIHRA